MPFRSSLGLSVTHVGSQFRVIEVRFFWGVETKKHFWHEEEAKETPKWISPQNASQNFAPKKTAS